MTASLNGLTRTATRAIGRAGGRRRPVADEGRWLHRLLRSEARVPLALSMSAAYATPAADTIGSYRRISLYTPELNLLAETVVTFASTPAIAYEYVWFAGPPVAQIESATSTRHDHFNDHLGTTPDDDFTFAYRLIACNYQCSHTQ